MARRRVITTTVNPDGSTRSVEERQGSSFWSVFWPVIAVGVIFSLTNELPTPLAIPLLAIESIIVALVVISWVASKIPHRR